MQQKTIVVVDNCKGKKIEETDRWIGLQNAAEEFNRGSCNVKISLETIKFDEMNRGANLQMLCESCGAILSGSSHSLNNYDDDPSVRAMFEDEISFVRKTTKPLLGICFGHQIIGVAYGFNVDYCDTDEEGIFILEIDKPFDLITDKTSVIVVEMKHKKQIVYEPRFDEIFEIISSNDNCKIQIFQHKTKKVYGVQFHAETTDNFANEDGRSILNNFFEICAN